MWLGHLAIYLTRCGSAPQGRAADLIASRIPPGRVVESNGRIESTSRIPKRPVDSLMGR